jgi:hypothetical protein
LEQEQAAKLGVSGSQLPQTYVRGNCANDRLNFNAFSYEKRPFGRKFAILFCGPEAVRQDFLPDILKTNLLTPHMNKENIAYSPDIVGSDLCKIECIAAM